MKTINVNQVRKFQGKKVKVVFDKIAIIGTIEGPFLFNTPASLSGEGVCNSFNVKDEFDNSHKIIADTVKEIILLDISL